MLTGGYLSKLVLLAAAVESGHVRKRSDLVMIRFLGAEEQGPLLDLAAEVGLLESGEPFRLSESGKRIEMAYQETRNCALPFRMILSEYVRHVLPVWAYRIPAGRMELFAVLPPDVASCFHSSGLMDSSPDDTIVSWWSEMAKFIRLKVSDRREETGRDGEARSLCYERLRTGREPKWISFESNFAGYDILSVDSAEQGTPRRIEVKASFSSVSDASFLVTENEWNVAILNLDNYRFHLWSITRVVLLADIPAREVEPHIPKNNSLGCWKKAEIPFSAFASQFVRQSSTAICPPKSSSTKMPEIPARITSGKSSAKPRGS